MITFIEGVLVGGIAVSVLWYTHYKSLKAEIDLLLNNFRSLSIRHTEANEKIALLSAPKKKSTRKKPLPM